MPSWFSWRRFPVIRREFILAFAAAAMITGALGLYVTGEVRGSLAAWARGDVPVAANQAHAARAAFAALEQAIERRDRGVPEPAEGIDTLTRAIRAAIIAAAERPEALGAPLAAVRTAHTAARSFEAWRLLREAPATPDNRKALLEQTARFQEAVDLLGELIAHDGAREHAAGVIGRDSALLIYAAVDVLLIGCLIALTVSRRRAAPTPAVPGAAQETAQKTVQKTVQEGAQERAITAHRIGTDFLTTMSHELRTPLSAVIGFSEMIAKETFGPVGQPQYKAFADDILDSGRHLMAIVTDILDMARAQSGTIDLCKRTIRPETVIEDAARTMRDKALEGGLTLTTCLAVDLPAIAADAARLRQILLNLLSNAIRFTPAGGSVSVEAYPLADPDAVADAPGDDPREAGWIAIRIRDTGIGMAPADIPRAQLPFTQADTSLSRSHGGTGLGLPLTKILVEMHGGRMDMDSALDTGTAVTVFLPAVIDAVSGNAPVSHVSWSEDRFLKQNA